MNKLWAFGCSFTAEYNPIDGLFFPFENNYDKYRKYRGGTLPNVWVDLLAKKINYKPYNCAIGGSSNNTIFNQFIDVVDLIKENDILIFGWTSLTRFPIVNLNEDIMINLLPNATNYGDAGFSKNTMEEILVNKSHKLWINEVLNWIKLINIYCKEKKVEVYHWASDDLLFNQHSKFIDERFIVINDEQSNKTHLLGYLNLPQHFGGVLKARIVEETNGEIIDDHMGEFGHINQCEYFYNHIKKHSKILNE
jgi:hypothetical protein